MYKKSYFFGVCAERGKQQINASGNGKLLTITRGIETIQIPTKAITGVYYKIPDNSIIKDGEVYVELAKLTIQTATISTDLVTGEFTTLKTFRDDLDRILDEV